MCASFFFLFFFVIPSETKAGAAIRITHMKIESEGGITFRATFIHAQLFSYTYTFTATAARFQMAIMSHAQRAEGVVKIPTKCAVKWYIEIYIYIYISFIWIHDLNSRRSRWFGWVSGTGRTGAPVFWPHPPKEKGGSTAPKAVVLTYVINGALTRWQVFEHITALTLPLHY